MLEKVAANPKLDASNNINNLKKKLKVKKSGYLFMVSVTKVLNQDQTLNRSRYWVRGQWVKSELTPSQTGEKLKSS